MAIERDDQGRPIPSKAFREFALTLVSKMSNGDLAESLEGIALALDGEEAHNKHLARILRESASRLMKVSEVTGDAK